MSSNILTDMPIVSAFKNLLYYVQQNFLIIVDLLLKRLSSKKPNKWAEQLKIVIQYRRFRDTMSKNEMY